MPTLAPRASAPRLAGPRLGGARSSGSIRSGIAGPRSTSRYWRDDHHHGDSWRSHLWSDFWDPWHHHSHYSSWHHHHHWSHWHGWTYGSHCGSFSWGISLWHPFWYWRHSYWDHCYADTFWHSWTSPHCVSTSYWWYPSSVYCPSYFYVPSATRIVEVPVVVADDPVPAGGGSTEVIVAGGGVVGSARAVDNPAGGSLATSLATKYVELGDFYFRAERFADAAEAYGKARNYAPDDASVHFVYADAVFANGDYHYAAFLIAEGLRLDPDLAAAETDKRTFYADATVFDRQQQALERYLEQNAYDAQAWLVRGYNLAFSKRPDDAKAAFERVLTIDPDNRAARTFLAARAPKPAEPPTDR